jgi:hypothetical protein
MLLAFCMLCVLCLTAGYTSTKQAGNVGIPGLEYQLRELSEPRPNRVHILRIDLSEKGIEPAVILPPDPDGDGPAEVALTNPLKLADDPRTVAFINTNPWDCFPDETGRKNHLWYEGQPVDIHGLAASGGVMRSQPGMVNVWIDTGGRVFIAGNPDKTTLAEGMAGFNHILKEGAIAVGPDEIKHPRTAIGIDQSGRILWLVVVDGRQKGYSEGMTIYELAGVMKGLGCWEAANMDGGGSSIMGLAGADGRVKVVNSPSDRAMGPRRIRPLPMVLTIRKKN